MNTTQAVLSDLRSQCIRFNFPVLSEVEIRKSIANLSRLAETMSHRTPRFQHGNGLDPEAVWKEWERNNFAHDKLTRREWQTLCGSPLTAIRLELITALRDFPEPLGRLANFIGIASAYFRQWRPEGDQFAPAAAIEKLLLRELERASSKSKNRVFLAWKKYPQLFSPRASEWIAETSLKDHVSVSDAARSVYVEPASLLVTKSLETAAERATSALIKTPISAPEDKAVDQLIWINKSLFAQELNAGIYRKCVGSLISSSLPDRYPMLRQLLTQLVTDDARLGDPRLAENGANWRHLPDGPREIFLSWMAQQYIQLFFDIVVPKSDDNRRRAEFWLHYARRKGNIKDFQVAVSSEDMWKVDRSQEAKGFSYARVSASSNASSAFLMEFHAMGERYVVVDFSETGNAACIYTRAVFEGNGASFRRRSFNMSELRNTQTRLDSINHMGAWEIPAERKLRRLGIIP